jgi:hypothetical protein
MSMEEQRTKYHDNLQYANVQLMADEIVARLERHDIILKVSQ